MLILSGSDAKVSIKITIFESFMEKIYKYTVAGHTFAVGLPEEADPERYLLPYSSFKCKDESAPVLFTLHLSTAESLRTLVTGKVKECLNDEAPYFWIFDKAGSVGSYDFGFSYSRSRPDCVLIPVDDYSEATVYVPSAYVERLAEFALSNAMMLMYTFRTAPFDTLMIHASVTVHDGGGYVFLGRSGTGKSTHSRLWLENIDGTYLLNDDNPVVRVIDGEVFVYGTPWSGKTPCYRNEVLPLKAAVRLSQAPVNRISSLSALKAYASLMPACSCMRWDRASVDALHKTVEKVITKIGNWHLECLPDSDAARVCHEAVTA